MNNELIKVITNEKGQQLVSARELHEFLEINSNFTTWFKRMCEYGFEENVDFTEVWSDSKNGNAVEFLGSSQKMSALGYELDYIITLNMAKELSMIQRTEKGKQARQYFITCEKQLKEIQSKAQLLLDIYNGGQPAVIASKKLTEIEVAEATKPLVYEIEVLQPQAVIGDRFTNSDNNYDIGLFSKVLSIKSLGRNNLFAFLRNKEILRHNNEPYQKYMEYFKVIVTDDSRGHINSKTLVKSKGVNFIVKRLIKDGYIVVKSVDEILEELNNSL